MSSSTDSDPTPPHEPPAEVSIDTRRRAQGCGLAFIGMVVLTLTPAVGSWIDIPPRVSVWILVVALAFLVVGAAFGIVGAGDDD